MYNNKKAKTQTINTGLNTRIKRDECERSYIVYERV